MSRKRFTLAVGAAALMLFCFASSQAAVDKPVVGHVSFGPSFPNGTTADFLDSGWALHGGATWFSPDKPLGLRLDFGVDWFDMKRSVLDQIDTTPESPATIP